MAIVQFFRETALPSTLQANSIYLVAPTAKPNYVELYVTGNSTSTIKRIINSDDIQAMINTALAGFSQIQIVADIAARDAIASPITGAYVLVIDASADATVTAGAASYIHNGTLWVKVTEYESMDLSLTWAALQNKPSSAVADIDDAVTKRHLHANKTQLDKINEDGSGNFTYNDALPKIAWNTTGW